MNEKGFDSADVLDNSDVTFLDNVVLTVLNAAT
jgi:hypothetical protein